MQTIIIAVIVTLVVAVPASLAIASAHYKNTSAKKVGSAEEKAREIIDEAVKSAETKKREALLEAKEEVSKRYAIKSLIVIIFMSCFWANSISCGIRAIVPSSFMISIRAPAG